MTKNGGIILTLIICIFALLVICYATWPIVVGGNNLPAIKTIRSINGTYLGHQFLDHFMWQLNFMVGNKIGPYTDLRPEQMERVESTVASMLFAAMVAMIGSISALTLFWLTKSEQPDAIIPKRTFITILFLTIIAGTLLRLILAVSFYGNLDMSYYERDADFGLKGGNIYAETINYNYSPIWFFILTTFKKIQLHFSFLPFHFVVRAFLTGVDLLTLVVLLSIANHEKISLTKTAIFFFLNPISFIITGFHGQFENLAILMILIGILLYLKLADKPVLRILPLWTFGTIGMIIKHNVFYELIIALNFTIKRYWVKISLFAISVIVFLGTFIPYWSTGKNGIINNAFLYSPAAGGYGINTLAHCPPLKYVFIAGLFLFPLFLKGKDIIRQCLFGFLFFLVFATGIGTQYFLLPIAFGSLHPSKGFILYTLLTSAFIIGSPNYLSIPGFHLLKWNIVWIGATYWFIEQIRLDRQTSQAIIR